MNPYYLAAAVVMVLVGAIHSILGEHLIFRRMRKGTLIPTHGGDVLRERNVRILWASWHLQTALGLSVAAVLAWLARQPATDPVHAALAPIIAAGVLAGAVLVLVGTKARHPGWAALLIVAVLTVAGQVL